jgi:hypothetical protein
VAHDDFYHLGPEDGAAKRFEGNVMDNDEQSLDWISRADAVVNAVWKVRTADGELEILVTKPGPGEAPTVVTTTEGGKVWINPDGSFQYQPGYKFVGEDTFQYQLNDGDNSPSEWATVTFNVEGPDNPQPPVAVDDNYEVVEGSRTTQGSVLDNDAAGTVVAQVRYTDVLGNVVVEDVPPEGAKITSELHGIVFIYQDGNFHYASPVRDHGDDIPDVDHFEYRVKDANGQLSNWATVNIDILDTVPVAVDDFYHLGPEDGAAKRFEGNVMDNDKQSLDWISRDDDVVNAVWKVRATDGEQEVDVVKVNPGEEPTFVTTSEGGKVWINPDGSFQYQPGYKFVGEDSFQYQLNDGDDSPSEWATVTFNVQGPENVVLGGVGHEALIGTDDVTDVFTWTLADLDGGGSVVKNTVTNFNAAEGDKLDLRDLLHDGDGYLFDADHLSVSASGGNTTIVVSPIGSSVSELNIVIEGVDLTGGFEGQSAIDHLLKNGNLVDDK